MIKKNFYKIISCLSLAVIPSLALAQQAEVDSLMKTEDFAAAKQLFLTNKGKKLLSNPSYGLKFGICCMETGDNLTALKYTKNAVRRRVRSGEYYLAKVYNRMYNYPEALKVAESYLKGVKRQKRNTSQAEELVNSIKENIKRLEAVERIAFIDSVVVNKKDFLKAYKIGKEMGSIYMFNSFFNTKTSPLSTVYQTERRNLIVYGKKTKNGVTNIYKRNKDGNEWGKEIILPNEVNAGKNNDYPFITSDGATIYFASDKEGGMGGYDIYATNYDVDNDEYLNPSNLGMPFNSPYNDYLYVIDEVNNLGWFASDRYQPKDKVCIYIFIPNKERKTYSKDVYNRNQLISFAVIHSIKDSQTDTANIKEAKKRLMKLSNTDSHNPEETGDKFTFIIDDDTDYHYLSDFKTIDGKNLYVQYQRLKETKGKIVSQLDILRNEYEKGGKDLKGNILSLEKNIISLDKELISIEKKIRLAEKR